MMLAAYHNKPDAVDCLLSFMDQQGIDKDALLLQKNDQGQSALAISLRRGSLRAAERLASSITVRQKQSDGDIFELAILRNDPPIVELLLPFVNLSAWSGSPLSMKDLDEHPLSFAIHKRTSESFKCLLPHADITLHLDFFFNKALSHFCPPILKELMTHLAHICSPEQFSSFESISSSFILTHYRDQASKDVVTHMMNLNRILQEKAQLQMITEDAVMVSKTLDLSLMDHNDHKGAKYFNTLNSPHEALITPSETPSLETPETARKKRTL